MKAYLRFGAYVVLSLVLTIGATPCHAEKVSNKKPLKPSRKQPVVLPAKKAQEVKGPQSPYRGWDHIVEMLRKDGIPEQFLKSVYQDKRMPKFTAIPFSVAPRESHAMYENFHNPEKLTRAVAFLEQHSADFSKAEWIFKVNRYVVAAILLVETHLGKVTGKELVIYRLSRLASVTDSKNLAFNLKEQRKKDPKITFEQIKTRGDYLVATFYPELKALFQIASKQRVDLLAIKGSSAGAFGLPQFLPSSFLKFGVDANNDGAVSLFHESDAIFSTAHYLSSYGWRDDSSLEEKRAVVWRYNHSDAYVDTVLRVAEKLARFRDSSAEAGT